MSAASEIAITENRTAFLFQVLTEMREGRLLVPRFQRHQAWKPEQRLELLRSIQRNIPIGALLFWRTKVKLSPRDTLGPFKVRPSAEVGAQRDYILDGLQRLETLYAALYARRDGKPSPGWRFAYDLEAEDFCLASDDDPPSAMPLHFIVTGVDLLNFQRTLQGPRASVWIARSDAIAQAFRYYQVPTVTLATDDLELATTAFERINSRGTKMSRTDMLAALSWSPTFDLRRRIDVLRQQGHLPVGWEDVDDETVLDVVLRGGEMSLGRREIDAAAERIKTLPGVLVTALEGLGDAARFLKEQAGIPTRKFLPYRMQAVLLADACTQAKAPTRALLRWFWWSTFLESFGGISGAALDRMAEYVRRIAQGETAPWPVRVSQASMPFLPRRIDARSALSRGLCVLLMARNPMSPASESYDPEVLATMHSAIWLRIVPDRPRTPANLILAQPEHAARIRSGLKSGRWIDDALWLASHAIPKAAAMAYRAGDLGTFFSERQRALLELVRLHLRTLGRPAGLRIAI